MNWKSIATNGLTGALGAIILAIFGWITGLVGLLIHRIPVVPEHAVVAFRDLTECPVGDWKKFDLGPGRYIVGLTDGGRLNGLQGEPLSDLENRPTGEHGHTVVALQLGSPWGSGGTQVADAWNGHGGSSRITQSYPTTETWYPSDQKSKQIVKAIPGTNAPYVQLLYCEKI